MTQPLTERLGQPFVIEPWPGAGTNLATEFVVRAAPDGYTLLFVGAPNAINASLYSNLNFNFVRDIAPVAGIARVPMVLIVHPAVPATTIPELLAYAKANPSKINMASSGIGTTPHLAGELFRMMAGVDIQQLRNTLASADRMQQIALEMQTISANPRKEDVARLQALNAEMVRLQSVLMAGVPAAPKR